MYHRRLLSEMLWTNAEYGKVMRTQISKPGPESLYPAYVVGDSDKVVNEIWVAAVTKPKSNPDQVE